MISEINLTLIDAEWMIRFLRRLTLNECNLFNILSRYAFNKKSLYYI